MKESSSGAMGGLGDISALVVDVKSLSVFDYVEKIKSIDGSILGYRVLQNLCYYSKRYDKFVVVEKGERLDGATYAPDLDSFTWFFHDELKASKTWQDGSKCSNMQASFVINDIFKEEGRWFRAKTWFLATWMWGTVVH